MISLAGRYLPLITSEAAAWIAKFIDVRDVVQWDYTSQNHNLYHLAPPGDISPPPIDIGTFSWPSGASQFAVGYFIADDDDVAYLNRVAFTPTGIQGMYLKMDNRKSLDDVDPANTGITTSVYMLPPRPLSQIDECNGMWLLTVVDVRYFWWFKRGIYNIDPGVTTWESLLLQISSDLNIANFTYSTPVLWGTPSNRFTVSDQPIPLYADCVAFYCGNRFARKLDGTVTAINADSTVPLDQANFNKISPADGPFFPMAGGVFSDFPIHRFLPREVTVVFGRTDDGVYSSSPYTRTFSITTLQANGDLDNFNFANTTGFVGEKVLTGDNTAIFVSPGVVPTNLADLEEYAESLAASWYKWAVSSYDINLSGIANWNPTANDATVKWTYRSDMCCTRIQRGPFTHMDWGRFRRSSLSGERSWILDGPSTPFSLTVQELDGSPTVPDVNEINFDQDDGLTVTDNGGGSVTIRLLENSTNLEVGKTCATTGVLTIVDGVLNLDGTPMPGGVTVVTGTTDYLSTVSVPTSWIKAGPVCLVDPADCCPPPSGQAIDVTCTCDIGDPVCSGPLPRILKVEVSKIPTGTTVCGDPYDTNSCQCLDGTLITYAVWGTGTYGDGWYFDTGHYPIAAPGCSPGMPAPVVYGYALGWVHCNCRTDSSAVCYAFNAVMGTLCGDQSTGTAATCPPDAVGAMCMVVDSCSPVDFTIYNYGAGLRLRFTQA